MTQKALTIQGTFFSNLKCVNMKYNGKEKDWCPELIHEHVIIETYVCI